MNFSLSFYSENEQISFKTAYTIVIGKELGGGGETQVILQVGSLSYVIERRGKTKGQLFKPS